ncbi:Exopolysaccharide biosynthesis protein [Alkaliphilus metalliredigens QYMF]|uniref:Exopolysaccharide biosynthesis protein n=2 Tax=Alkaliphilus TaxID=114627 RepID=A6TKB7_ALKMQ|nr:Exopolysaccharide biosynthesis protein [Alkaliphilus metalliredigens QYMF]ABR48107.1 Exopolysaccharide biosynthesis protein [Alkaliphilus metalliredigens QYMF]ABR50449.1 Exopolysaccharide biosynthesis protein [Alkaliphilus metalliredigens QYMF]
MKYTMRRYDTTIHVLEVPKQGVVIMPCLGDRTKRQPVQQIRHSYFEANGYKRIGAVNGGFFDGNRTLPYGMFYVDSGFLLSESWAGDAFLELVHENGKLHIDDITANQLKTKYKKANWAISLSYSLVVGGKMNIMKGDKFPFTNQSHPRTLIGDNQENYIFVVTEGRMTKEKGLTAVESARVMLELGCNTAINADGGGSSAMDVEGKIQNKYYDNRAVADGILIYTKEPYEITGKK